MTNIINDSKHWRDRSVQARAIADLITDVRAKRLMIDIARGYEKLAERSEGRTIAENADALALAARRNLP